MDEKEFDYMNVIPLVDVMLVLLTIVLTTSTFIATGGIPVALPQASKSPLEALKTQTVEIDGRGKVHLNGVPVTLPALKAELLGFDRQTPILIRADREIALQTFVDVLDIAKTLGFGRINLQTEQKR